MTNIKATRARVESEPEPQIDDPDRAFYDLATLRQQLSTDKAVLAEIEEYVDNYVDIDWEGRPNWATDIKVMLEKLS